MTCSVRHCLKDEYGDLSLGLRLIGCVVWPCLIRPRPPLVVLRALGEVCNIVFFHGSVLQLDMWVCLQIPIPHRMRRGAAFGGDDGIATIVLDAHEGGLAEFPSLGTDACQHDDR